MPFTEGVWGCIFAAIIANIMAHLGLKRAERWKLQLKKYKQDRQKTRAHGSLTEDRPVDDIPDSVPDIAPTPAPVYAGRRRRAVSGGASIIREEDKDTFLYKKLGIAPSEVSDAVYGSFGAFTNASNVTSTNTPEKMLNVGFTFFLVIILASYTANLASNLIRLDTLTPNIADMDDANTRGLKICVGSGSTAQTVISSSYPRIDLVSIKSSKVSVTMAAVVECKCDGAVIFKYEWDSRQNLHAANPHCNLVAVDYNIRPFSGAW